MKLMRRLVGYGPFAVAAALGLNPWNVIHAAPPNARALLPVSATTTVGAIDDAEAMTNVQIAWLADPGLYTCNLSARLTAKGLEVHGYIGSEAIKQKAIAIARALYAGPVIDQLQIHQGIPIQLSRGAAPDELAQMASDALAEAMGDKVLNLRVVCPSPGRVEITGSIPTLEDKLAVSKCMKSLSGCTHVVNRTSAPGSPSGAAIVGNIPLMMSKSIADASGGWKPVPDVAPKVAQRPVPSPKVAVVKNEEPPAFRPVVTPPVKSPYDKSEPKFTAVSPSSKSGYAAVTDSKPVNSTPRAEAKKPVEPNWDKATVAMPEPKPFEFKPVEMAKATENPPVEIRTGKSESSKNSTSRPQVLNLLADEKPVANNKPASDDFKAVDPKSEATKVEVASKQNPVPTPAPQPIIVPPIVGASVSNGVTSPYGSNAPAPTPPVAVVELPKPADLPNEIELPKAVAEVPTAGKAAVTDVPQPTMPMAAVGAPAEPAKVEPLANNPEPAKSMATKTERAVASLPTPPNTPVKPVTFANELVSTKTGVDAISITLDTETARRAVEDICRGAGENLKVTAGQNRQLTIDVKLTSQVEWDRLYNKVKSLPEINGYSIVYNAQVEAPIVKQPAAPTIKTANVATTASALTVPPMMGVLRNNNRSSEPPSPVAAKEAIEKLCEGKAIDLSVRVPAGKQVAVTMKVASAADWEMLYAQIKALPEIAGCSIIYSVSVK